MGLLDGLLGQVAGGTELQNLAAKVGLTPDQVDAAVRALGEAHAAPRDTVATAADQTGVDAGTLEQIVGYLGGEGALTRAAGMLGEQGGLGGVPGGLFGKD